MLQCRKKKKKHESGNNTVYKIKYTPEYTCTGWKKKIVDIVHEFGNHENTCKEPVAKLIELKWQKSFFNRSTLTDALSSNSDFIDFGLGFNNLRFLS